MSELVPQIPYPELFFGFVAPIGTSLTPVENVFAEELQSFSYSTHKVKITDIYETLRSIIKPKMELSNENEFKRYKTFIAYGDQVRAKIGDDSFFGAVAVQQIIDMRRDAEEEGESNFEQNAFLVRQLKRPEEVELLRSVYGQHFFQVSVYSKRDNRVSYLADKFSVERGEINSANQRPKAEKLVNKDENEVDDRHGQRVGKIFHDADFIINLDEREPELRKQVRRFIELVFSSNAHTPSRMEYGMYGAHSAALRTADLSRQVGAAIFRPTGEIVAMGSNEVPRAGGGSYWPVEGFDDRDFKRGEDSNEVRKRELLNDVLTAVDIRFDELNNAQLDRLKDSAFMDALEYGRVVHAEMAAITDAARTDGKIRDGILYSTTFPCHMCAKHIVASGIAEVVFLEPYPKSLVERLHQDSISVEGRDRGQYNRFASVKFRHFYGVTPRRYAELFKKGKRKGEGGKFNVYPIGGPKPFIDVKAPSYIGQEDRVSTFLSDKLERIRNRSPFN